MIWNRGNRLKVVLGTAFAACAVAAPSASAANFEVTNLNDAGGGSLRAAVTAANGAGGADAITFQAGLTGTIPLSGQISITEAVAITGPGASVVSVSGSDSDRVFSANLSDPNGVVTISGLTIRDGLASGGGGISNSGDGSMVLDGVEVTANNGFGSSQSGAGIESAAPLTIRNSAITDNTLEEALSSTGAGINRISGSLDIVNSTISGNEALNGAGIYSTLGPGTTTIRNSTIAGNVALSTGGGIHREFMNGTANPVNLTSTIAADNSAPTGADVYEIGSDASGRYTAGYSLVEDATGATIVDSPGNNVFGADPALGPLAGAPTRALAPAAGSPALDKGLAPGLVTDQNGATRIVDDPGIANAPGGDGSDIGSIEAAQAPGTAPVLGGPIVGEANNGRFCLGQRVTITGTPGRDRIQGTDGADVIRGMRGNDVINGLDGDDVICGDKGRDRIVTGGGDDEVRGGRSGDTIQGESGDDTLRGGSGRDEIFGGEGDDAMFGGSKLGKAGPSGGSGTGGKVVGNRCDGGAGTDAVTGCEIVLNVP